MRNQPYISKYMALHAHAITLYITLAHYSKINNKELAVVQQRYCQKKKTKATYWNRIDPWLVDELYLHKNFEVFFNDRAVERINGIYPTVTVRQIMFGLKMKPLPRERWETCFDRKLI